MTGRAEAARVQADLVGCWVARDRVCDCLDVFLVVLAVLAVQKGRNEAVAVPRKNGLR
jgi:hypothetical protein